MMKCPINKCTDDNYETCLLGSCVTRDDNNGCYHACREQDRLSNIQSIKDGNMLAYLVTSGDGRAMYGLVYYPPNTIQKLKDEGKWDDMVKNSYNEQYLKDNLGTTTL
jgi:hypothetical protein